MSDVRQALIERGWRQGVILAPDSFEHPGAIGFLVLNQTCDCINPDFNKEPHLELLPLEMVSGKPDSRLKNGQNPRHIHFQIREKGEEIWVSAQIPAIIQTERANHENLSFAPSLEITGETLKDLIRWRAHRYLRPAFPDSFENAFRPLSKRFGAILADHERNIDSLLIAISPSEEVVAGDFHEIQLHLMVTPEVMGSPDTVRKLQALSGVIQNLLADSGSFGSVTCALSPLDGMSLWKARRYLDFNRYDYLSFGRDEDSPQDDLS